MTLNGEAFPMSDGLFSAGPVQMAAPQAIRRASARTGVEFDYLYNVAVRESRLDPSAKAKTSSAAGLFQFIEQTWLSAVKTHGGRHGLAREAAAIEQTASGKYRVADPELRQKILDRRFDPQAAAALAAEFARDNKTRLEASLGRTVDAAELYAAHFLGAGGAETLLKAPKSASAAALLPAAAKANVPVFYDGKRARSVGELIDGFKRTINGTSATETSATVKLANSALGHKASPIAPGVNAIPPAPTNALPPVLPAAVSVLSDHGVRGALPSQEVTQRPALRTVDVDAIGPKRTAPPLRTASVSPSVDQFSANLIADTVARSSDGPQASDINQGVMRGQDGLTGATPLSLVILQALDPSRLRRGRNER